MTTGTSYSYFQTFSSSGVWTGVGTPTHTIVQTGAPAYCLQTEYTSPSGGGYTTTDPWYYYDAATIYGLQAILDRLNKENAEAVIVPIRAEDLSRFEKLARQYGALYAAVQSKDGHSDVVHIISNVNYSAQLNTVLQVMGYEAPERGHAN